MTPDPQPLVSRRAVVAAGGLGAAALAVGAWGTWQAVGRSSTGGASFAEPPVRRSADGLLDVVLEAAPGVTLAGRSTHALGYNGHSPGPTLVVRPGDLVRVTLRNRLDQATNLRTHGLHVSPTGKSDNVFRVVVPGTDTDYEYRIPDDHPTGTF
ncbi:multicopper oxidase domain-containing protein [Phycicoccus mangrovi]|nr:multicopper oxidase domain-containing protein [Phycicoccus mangrovi]